MKVKFLSVIGASPFSFWDERRLTEVLANGFPTRHAIAVLFCLRARLLEFPFELPEPDETVEVFKQPDPEGSDELSLLCFEAALITRSYKALLRLKGRDKCGLRRHNSMPCSSSLRFLQPWRLPSASVKLKAICGGSFSALACLWPSSNESSWRIAAEMARNGMR